MPVPYFVKKRLLQIIIAVPAPRAVNRLLRLWVDTKAGENFGDMTINGEFDFLDAHGPDCRVLFDVGASDGVWTARALRANPQARIHCFEPARAARQRLLARGFPPNVTCVASGLSDAEGTMELYTVSGSVHDRRGPGVDAAAEGARERITVTTIDDYCAREDISTIDLLKIDAEGHDLAVLRGGSRMIREGRIARIQFEYGPRNVHARVFLRDFFALFAGLPYTLHQVMPGRLAPVTYSHRLENLQYKNFVALRSSPGPVATVHAISREAFDACNPFRAAGSDQVLQEIEWFADARQIVLGVIAIDLEDTDHFIGVLGRDAAGVFRAIDVDAGLPTRDEARAALLSKMQAALASGETVFPQDD